MSVTISRNLIKDEFATEQKYRDSIFTAISTGALKHRKELTGGQLRDLQEHHEAVARLERGDPEPEPEVEPEVYVRRIIGDECSGSYGQPTRLKRCKCEEAMCEIQDGVQEKLENNWVPVPWRKN